MGTRGLLGFRADQKDYLTYNHFDSYPDCLGEAMVGFARVWGSKAKQAELKNRVVSLKMVGDNDAPTPEIIAKAKKLGLYDPSVSTGRETEYYALLRKAQGEPDQYLAIGVMPDGADFALESLFCEYAYIINLDTGELEFYEGFNQDWNAEGRYAGKADKVRVYENYRGSGLRHEEPNEYAGIRLVGTCPLDAIPDDWKTKFYPADKD